MGLTRAQRHNRMLEKTFAFYHQFQDSLPPCQLYARFLEIAEDNGISKDEARDKYGQYTVKQWEELLGLGWNKKQVNR